MLKFLDTWDRSQKLCWIDSCKAKISELEKQMEACLTKQDFSLYFKINDRLDQEVETLQKLVRETAIPLTKQN